MLTHHRIISRTNYSPTSNSTICIDHFEGKYLVQHSNRPRLNYSFDPIPSIHPLSIHKSQRVIPHKPREPPVKRIYKEDELPLFKAKFKFDTLQDISLFLTTSNEYKELKIDINESHVVAYCLNIESGIVVIKECIYIDQNFNLQLSYEGIPLPVPAYIRQSPFYQVLSLDMLTNLPNYCRNFTPEDYEINVIKELIKLTHYSPKRRPKYSSSALRFALLLRYTSNSGYNFLKKHLPLPSETLLKSLKSNSIQGGNALSGLRDNDLIGNDVVLLLDEMHLQQQVFLFMKLNTYTTFLVLIFPYIGSI